MKRGFAFVFMPNVEEAERAIATLHDQPFGMRQRRLNITWAKGDGDASRREQVRDAGLKPNRTLFVANFDVATTNEHHLRQHFEPFGELGRVQIPPRKTFAFVQFVAVEDAQKALEATHNNDFNGNNLVVQVSGTAGAREGRRTDGTAKNSTSRTKRRWTTRTAPVGPPGGATAAVAATTAGPAGATAAAATAAAATAGGTTTAGTTTAGTTTVSGTGTTTAGATTATTTAGATTATTTGGATTGTTTAGATTGTTTAVGTTATTTAGATTATTTGGATTGTCRARSAGGRRGGRGADFAAGRACVGRDRRERSPPRYDRGGYADQGNGRGNDRNDDDDRAARRHVDSPTR